MKDVFPRNAFLRKGMRRDLISLAHSAVDYPFGTRKASLCAFVSIEEICLIFKEGWKVASLINAFAMKVGSGAALESLLIVG